MRKVACSILLSLLVLAAWPDAAISKVKVHHVDISAMTYTPSTIHALVGDTIIWTNSDLVPHTVTAANKSFNSGSMKPKATWRLQVKRPGKLEYLCLFHPTMKGLVVVK